MSTGWIKLHRGLIEWEWYSDINTSRLFIHCLLRANHADKDWRGITIKRGSFYSSLDSLARETGLSVSQIRTSFKKLGLTGEVTSQPQATGRMIYVSNYELYQSDDKPNDRQLAGKSQASDKPVTTNKNEKNENNVRTIFTNVNISDSQQSEIVRIRKKNKGGSITDRVATALVNEFTLAGKLGWSLDEMLTEWETRGWKSFKAEWIASKKTINGLSQSANQSIEMLNNLELK